MLVQLLSPVNQDFLQVIWVYLRMVHQMRLIGLCEHNLLRHGGGRSEGIGVVSKHLSSSRCGSDRPGRPGSLQFPKKVRLNVMLSLSTHWTLM
jgi:hypothetical protein